MILPSEKLFPVNAMLRGPFTFEDLLLEEAKELARPQKPAPSHAGSDAINSGTSLHGEATHSGLAKDESRLTVNSVPAGMQTPCEAEGREAQASDESDSFLSRRPSVSICPECGHDTKFHLTPDGMPMACDYLPMDCYTLCGCQHELQSYDHVEGDR